MPKGQTHAEFLAMTMPTVEEEKIQSDQCVKSTLTASSNDVMIEETTQTVPHQEADPTEQVLSVEEQERKEIEALFPVVIRPRRRRRHAKSQRSALHRSDAAHVESTAVIMVHPLFQVADVLVSHIQDYPTLVYLSMTCSVLRHIITRSQTTLLRAVNHLEMMDLRHTCYTQADVRPGGMDGALQGRSPDGTCHFDYWRNYWRDSRRARRRQYSINRDACSFIENESPLRQDLDWTSDELKWVFYYDIIRYGNRNLHSAEWLPCYGCHSLKRGHTAFFPDMRRGCFYLLGCKRFERRCIQCCIDDPERWPDELDVYCTEIKKLGYRIRCRHCKRAEHVHQLPKRHLRRQQACSECYPRVVASQKPSTTKREKKIAEKESNALKALLHPSSLSPSPDRQESTPSSDRQEPTLEHCNTNGAPEISNDHFPSPSFLSQLNHSVTKMYQTQIVQYTVLT